jgi:hypothetical protein
MVNLILRYMQHSAETKIDPILRGLFFGPIVDIFTYELYFVNLSHLVQRYAA